MTNIYIAQEILFCEHCREAINKNEEFIIQDNKIKHPECENL
jgi:hypothetical protein